jgi:hypothetical protein
VLYVTRPRGHATRVAAIPDGWVFAGPVDLSGSGAAQLLFEDSADAACHVWTLDNRGLLAASTPLDLGAAAVRPLLLFVPPALDLTVSAIPDQTVNAGGKTGPLAFTVGPANAIDPRVTATSSDPALIQSLALSLDRARDP